MSRTCKDCNDEPCMDQGDGSWLCPCCGRDIDTGVKSCDDDDDRCGGKGERGVTISAPLTTPLDGETDMFDN